MRVDLKYGDRVTVKWPGGFHDFVIQYTHEERHGDGWVTVHGLVVEPNGPEYRANQGFYARRTGTAEYTMLPYKPRT